MAEALATPEGRTLELVGRLSLDRAHIQDWSGVISLNTPVADHPPLALLRLRARRTQSGLMPGRTQRLDAAAAPGASARACFWTAACCRPCGSG